MIDDVKKLSFDIHPINLYLHGQIKISPLYYFDSIKNEVIIRLNYGNLDYGNFFFSIVTADL